MVVTSAVPVVVYEYDVYVPEFTVTQDYLDEYNKHAAPGKQWGPEKVGTKAGNVHVAYKVDNTYDSTLGLMTLEDYNNAAANVGSPDVPPIDMAAVFPHTQGGPYHLIPLKRARSRTCTTTATPCSRAPTCRLPPTRARRLRQRSR